MSESMHERMNAGMNTQWFDSQDNKYLEHFLGDKKKPKKWD